MVQAWNRPVVEPWMEKIGWDAGKRAERLASFDVRLPPLAKSFQPCELARFALFALSPPFAGDDGECAFNDTRNGTRREGRRRDPRERSASEILGLTRGGQLLQTLQHVWVLANQQDECGRLVVRFAPPLLPPLECSGVDANPVRKRGPRHMQAFASTADDLLINARQCQPLNLMRPQRDTARPVSLHRGDAFHQLPEEITLCSFGDGHESSSLVFERAVPVGVSVQLPLPRATAPSASVSDRRLHPCRTT